MRPKCLERLGMAGVVGTASGPGVAELNRDLLAPARRVFGDDHPAVEEIRQALGEVA